MQCIFYQDNASCDRSLAMMAKSHKLHFKLLLYHSILQIWIPVTLIYSQTRKKKLAGKRFRLNEEGIAETNAYFEAKDNLFFKKGTKMRGTGMIVSVLKETMLMNKF